MAFEIESDCRKGGACHTHIKGNYRAMLSADIRCLEKRPHDAWLTVSYSGRFNLQGVEIACEEGKFFSLFNEKTAWQSMQIGREV